MKDHCENCGIEYDDFRTGLSFQEVKDMLWVESNQQEDWKYKRRHSVLGKWHQIKLELWTEHKDTCIKVKNIPSYTEGLEVEY